MMPGVGYGGKERTRSHVNLHTTEPKLRRLLADFRFAPLVEVLRKQAMLPENTAWCSGS